MAETHQLASQLPDSSSPQLYQSRSAFKATSAQPSLTEFECGEARHAGDAGFQFERIDEVEEDDTYSLQAHHQSGTDGELRRTAVREGHLGDNAHDSLNFQRNWHYLHMGC